MTQSDRKASIYNKYFVSCYPFLYFFFFHSAKNVGALDLPHERERGGGGSGQGPGREKGGEVVPVHHIEGDQGGKVLSIWLTCSIRQMTNSSQLMFLL